MSLVSLLLGEEWKCLKLVPSYWLVIVSVKVHQNRYTKAYGTDQNCELKLSYAA